MREGAATRYEPIAVSSESTVVAEFIPNAAVETSYQSEADLEREFIKVLQSQAYDYLPITSEAHLVANLRTQLEALNGVIFSDAEWKRFFNEKIAGANDGIIEKTVRIQEDYVQVLKRDDGSTKNISFIDKKNIHNNRLQVINQYEIGEGEGGSARSNRYDLLTELVRVSSQVIALIVNVSSKVSTYARRQSLTRSRLIDGSIDRIVNHDRRPLRTLSAA